MNNHSLAKIKLKANQFMQQYEREETQREFQKQRVKQNIMIQIMSSRNKSQASQSNVRAGDLQMIDKNSRTLSANFSRVSNNSKAVYLDQKSISNVSRKMQSNQESNEHENTPIAADFTFKMNKNSQPFILVQGQSQNQEFSEMKNSQHQQYQEQQQKFQQSKMSDVHANQKMEKEEENFFNLKKQPIRDHQISNKFKFEQPHIEPESQEVEEVLQNDDEKCVFLTMEEQQSMQITNEIKNKNVAFEIQMEKSEPIDNIEELRKKKLQMLEKRRIEGIEQFRKKEEIKEQKRLDSSMNKGRASQAYSQKSNHKISEDIQPEPPRDRSRRKLPDTKSEVVIQQGYYGVGDQRGIKANPSQRRANGSESIIQTPKTIVSDARSNKSRNKNTIFGESPRRADKSSSKYSQQPKIEPKLRKNTFNKQSNKPLMINAIKNACLPGDLNKKQRDNLLVVLDRPNSSELFFVLLFGEIGKVKAIYTLDHSQTKLQKIYSEKKVPSEIFSQQIKNFYQYDSGSKLFKKLQCKSLSFAVHAIDLR